MESDHVDFPTLSRIANAILSRCGGQANLDARAPMLIQDAIDFVVDPVRTARTRVRELDNVEKTFVGLKIEHFFRDFIDVPKGLRDLSIDGIDVDVKNTVGSTWTIPPETYQNDEPILLFLVADDLGYCSMGLMVAKDEYLNPSRNRDSKRSVSAAGRGHIFWLVDRAPLPDSRWKGLDMDEFRQLRRVPGGTMRAAEFFRRHLQRPTHRSIIQALLHDQLDYMKRVRGNQGARDILVKEGIALLWGGKKRDRKLVLEAGLPPIAVDEFIAVKPKELAVIDAFKQNGVLP